MAVPDTVRRTQVDISDDESIRVYFDPNNDLPPMPSVSVVKDLRVDPEKKEMLGGWKDRYDGQSQWARPWWDDQRTFKAYRGTLIHFAILNELDDASGETYFHEVGDDEWGKEEYYAEYCLKKWSNKAPSANTDEVPHSPRRNKYDGEHAWDRATRDMKWAAQAFKQQVMDEGYLSRNDVITVEEFVYDTEYGYGGQYDLLYEHDGKTVLGDLKTSSAVRFDHKLQSAAYKRAVEAQEGITIDECAIMRLHPDSETVELSFSRNWDRSLEGLEHEFLALADKAHTKTYGDALEDARIELMDERDRTEQAELGEQTTDDTATSA